MKNPFSLLKEWKYKRLHRQQRIKRGFSDKDWWAFDWYLTEMIIKALEKFRDEGIGFPAELESLDEWKEILNTMIDGFRAYLEYDMLEDKSDNLTWQEWNTEERFDERFNAGMKLFVKYYGSLWD